MRGFSFLRFMIRIVLFVWKSNIWVTEQDHFQGYCAKSVHVLQVSSSVSDPGSGASLTPWIRDPVPFWPLDPGSGIGLFRFPDLGSRNPNSYFWELSDNLLGKKFYNSLKVGKKLFLQQFKNKIILHFGKFVATKKYVTTNFVYSSLL